MTVRQADERALTDAARGGSQSASAELFERHWLGAWRVAYALTGRREVAEDVVQDAFIQALGALGRFDGRRPFAAWLHRIVVNRALNVVRKERRLVPLDPAVLTTEDEPAVPDRALIEAVAGLPQDRRAVLVLRYALDHSPSEIADVLGIPVGTVNSRLARGLDELRTRLAPGGG